MRSLLNVFVFSDIERVAFAISGFKSSDVFDYAPALKWWDKNKENIYENLKEQQTIEMYYKKNNKIESEKVKKD